MTGQRLVDIDRNHTRFGCRNFKRIELALQQGRRHEMVGALPQALFEDGVRAMQKDDLQIAIRGLPQTIAIAGFQRRAGHDDTSALGGAESRTHFISHGQRSASLNATHCDIF